MTQKTLAIISDCRDDNARGRQEVRYKNLLATTPIFIGASSDLEAAGCLVDAIDAYQDREGIIVVNVAPRGNDYPNGVPFCYHKFGNLWIIGTPNCFSLATKFGLFTKTNETDVLEACSRFLPKEEPERIATSQFRSYEYLPYLAKWLSENESVPSKEIDIMTSDADKNTKDKIWYIDCFGNAKTTALEYKDSYRYPFYESLAKVPKDGKAYMTRGSSGYKDLRFLEIVIQKSSAASTLNLKIGDSI